MILQTLRFLQDFCCLIRSAQTVSLLRLLGQATRMGGTPWPTWAPRFHLPSLTHRQHHLLQQMSVVQATHQMHNLEIHSIG